MITNTNVRGYRAGVPMVGQASVLASGRSQELSGWFLKLLVALLTGAVLFVFVGSLFVEHQISLAASQLVAQEQLHSKLTAAAIDLRVQRVRLTSKERIMQLATSRLQLYPPERRQMHRF